MRCSGTSRMVSRRVSRSFVVLLSAGAAVLLLLSQWTKPFLVYQHLALDSIRVNFTSLPVRQNSETRPHKGFLLDTAHCRIPDIDPFDPAILQKIHRRGEIICQGKPSITYVDGPVVRINRSVVDEFYDGDFKYCQYQPIVRGPKNSDFSFSYGDMSKKFDHDVLVPPDHEFMRIYCYSQSEGKLSTNFHALVTAKEKVEQKSTYRFKQHKQKRNPKETLNVHMIGVDSVSRLNFLRQMRQTRTFLLDELQAFEMSGYNKVEDNTFVNIVPMMVGKFVHEIGWNESMRKQAFDDYNFLWHNFSKAGYRTLYAEDAPKIAIFVYGKEGFHTPPADYYNRPLALAMETQKSVWNRNHHCIVDRLETSMLLDYVTDFSRMFKDKPHFGFTFITRLTHDSISLVGSADYAYLKFLKRFQVEGHLNNTVLILYSDHGYRFGDMRNTYVGKVEERLPFLYLVFPSWFHKKYPKLAKNLRTNSRRLTTPFDIYETLKDILYFDGEDREASLSDRGISLLREVPPERSCQHAAILPHWCLCLEEREVPTNSTVGRRIAHALVGHINDILSPASHLCATLSLGNVSQVVQMQSNEKILRFEDSLHDVINKTVVYGERTEAPVVYQVTLSTVPGHALFEATLTHDPVYNIFKLAGSISRINAYRDQSICVENSKLKKFCYCSEK
ncbi:uncharacterized protein LOC101847301 [Aplysia californica]|uniref:Uncharacterized protein LOC101847301 n=1 Tax=Aplysia californica TaxID=6500 RepID=A0ABM0K8Z1_APLCA|nr:uncharacterized protein LOC101847301 [Aplysia californica]